jgi:hypothetical protein
LRLMNNFDKHNKKLVTFLKIFFYHYFK